ncbi:hypothetical protein, partial [Candidatus Villigracilis saccharophilus]|uniref:hypothetical protein n=1 Tax=Candidatus Villigracilis saccharophilus TaxID=3140684 RepID=UPI0031F1179C
GKSADHFVKILYQLNGFFSGKHTVFVWNGIPRAGCQIRSKHGQGACFGMSNPRGERSASKSAKGNVIAKDALPNPRQDPLHLSR